VDDMEQRLRALERSVAILEDWRNNTQSASARVPSLWIGIIAACTGIGALALQLVLAGRVP
jgi:hypothetical protein